jgi:hypothetical protein
VCLPKGYTMHYREKLPVKHPNDANHQKRAQQAPKRVRKHRRILPIHQPKARPGRTLDHWLGIKRNQKERRTPLKKTPL